MSEKTPQFWRDPQLPFVEARAIADGRQACYSLHSHEFFSIGAITGGVSTYVNGERRMQVSAGDLVIINPQQAHACNPIADRNWSYIMFYLDLAWIGALQQELLGGEGERFVPFSQPLSRDPALFHGLNRLHALLTDPLCSALEKQIAMVEYFSALQLGLGDVRQPETPPHSRLEAAAAFIDAHCTQPLTLDDICRAAALSPSYLIVALHLKFHQASKQGDGFDMAQIFTDTLTAADPAHAVTLVANHDTQPLQSLEAPVEPWFKPLAYALILLREQGVPCVFYPDLYGASYRDKGRDGGEYQIDMPAIPELEKLIAARQRFANGPQTDYFDDSHCVAFSRAGTAEAPGCVVVLTNGGESGKTIALGADLAHTAWRDFLGNRQEEITTDDQGSAHFPVNAGSVSVWVPAGSL